MNMLIKVLLVWISGVTGLPVGEGQPSIRLEAPASIQAFVNPQQSRLAGARVEHVMAYYDARREQIVLRRGWRADNPFDVSILVHELVHFMQDEAGRRYPCPGAREKEAYAAQEAWLQSQGIDLFDNDVLPINRMFVLVVTSCSH
jgi:hypothetical protein